MRLRHDPAAAPFVAAHAQVLLEDAAPAHRGAWRQALGLDAAAALALEIGCGRGRFILEAAQARPECGFLGLELRAEMVMQAIERVSELPPNLRFLCLNAALLPELFAAGEVDTVYLNFPDPWPKSRHAKRRLTAPPFLRQYREILSSDGRLRFKTDNRPLFDWTLENLPASGLAVVEIDYALDAAVSGPISEYEARFRRRGQPIYYLSAGRA